MLATGRPPPATAASAPPLLRPQLHRRTSLRHQQGRHGKLIFYEGGQWFVPPQLLPLSLSFLALAYVLGFTLHQISVCMLDLWLVIMLCKLMILTSVADSFLLCFEPLDTLLMAT